MAQQDHGQIPTDQYFQFSVHHGVFLATQYHSESINTTQQMYSHNGLLPSRSSANQRTQHSTEAVSFLVHERPSSPEPVTTCSIEDECDLGTCCDDLECANGESVVICDGADCPTEPCEDPICPVLPCPGPPSCTVPGDFSDVIDYSEKSFGQPRLSHQPGCILSEPSAAEEANIYNSTDFIRTLSNFADGTILSEQSNPLYFPGTLSAAAYSTDSYGADHTDRNGFRDFTTASNGNYRYPDPGISASPLYTKNSRYIDTGMRMEPAQKPTYPVAHYQSMDIPAPVYPRPAHWPENHEKSNMYEEQLLDLHLQQMDLSRPQLNHGNEESYNAMNSNGYTQTGDRSHIRIRDQIQGVPVSNHAASAYSDSRQMKIERELSEPSNPTGQNSLGSPSSNTSVCALQLACHPPILSTTTRSLRGGGKIRRSKKFPCRDSAPYPPRDSMLTSRGRISKKFDVTDRSVATTADGPTCHWVISGDGITPQKVCGDIYKTPKELHAHVKTQHIDAQPKRSNLCSWAGCPKFRSHDYGTRTKLDRHAAVHEGCKSSQHTTLFLLRLRQFVLLLYPPFGK